MHEVSYCFISNHLIHHQLPFCEEMLRLTHGRFVFVETEPLPEERRAMGYAQLAEGRDFVISAYKGEADMQRALQAAADADVAIIGLAPDAFIRERLRQNRLTFRYSERIFKKRDIDPLRQLKHIVKNLPYRNKPLGYLFSSAYAAGDFRRFGVRPERMFKWGYFPEVKEYASPKELISRKHPASILWAGRFIDWKHPELAVEVTRRLVEDGFDFQMSMVGNGVMTQEIEGLIRAENLGDRVHLLGAMPPEQVRAQMEAHSIFLFTSDRNEGWGAVLNEAMNSGCAVVANDEIGSVPFVLKNGENGLVYHHGDVDELYRKVKRLLQEPGAAKRLGENAYQTLVSEWNARNAAERLVRFCEQYMENSSFAALEEVGVMSRAERIK